MTFRIFVSGIPSKATTTSIVEYFLAFGYIEAAVPTVNEKKPSGILGREKASKGHPKGFCLLYAFDLETFERIVGQSQYEFYGRTLTVSRFKPKKEYQDPTNAANERRVIIKKVPIRIRQEDLQQLLETHYGRVERMFRFEAESLDKAVRKQLTRKHHSYSVVFETEESANKASGEGILRLQAEAGGLFIEKYVNKRKHAANKKQPMQFAPTSSHILQHSIVTLSPLAAQFSKPTHHSSSAQGGLEGPERISWASHVIKPTSKKYDHLLIAHRSSEFNICFNMQLQENSVSRRISGPQPSLAKQSQRVKGHPI